MIKEQQVVDYIKRRIKMWKLDAPEDCSEWREGYHEGKKEVAEEFERMFEYIGLKEVE